MVSHTIAATSASHEAGPAVLGSRNGAQVELEKELGKVSKGNGPILVKDGKESAPLCFCAPPCAARHARRATRLCNSLLEEL